MERYLLRCMELARQGGSAVEPNPRVGAVVVWKDTIIGEGYHERFGGAHAEVNAIDRVADKSLLAESTLYVSLEPCNHQGKTPACTALILAHRIPHVVVGALDPNPRMCGKSAEMLRAAGVKVEVAEANPSLVQLNEHFHYNQANQQPWVTLKWAQSADGFIAGADEAGRAVQTAISGPLSNVRVHRMRAEHQAILIGSRTALVDNPSLTTRLVNGRNPSRILFDTHGVVPLTAKLFADDAPVFVLRKGETMKRDHIQWVDVTDAASPDEVMSLLYQQYNIGSILVEGGAYTLESFLQAGCWNETVCIEAGMTLGRGVKAPDPSLAGNPVVKEKWGNDEVRIWRRT